MRYLFLLLICCLTAPPRARALEPFADFLYWKSTQSVDWVLNTSRSPADQFVAYDTLQYDFDPGFRVGVALEGTCDAKFYYTRFNTGTAESATGSLTGAFLGAKETQPPAPKLYFDAGQVESTIDYNMFDWDFGKRFNPTESLQVRPLVGIRGGWIRQSIQSQFQAQYPGLLGTIRQSIVENMRNDFWGLGPKFGVETSLTLRRGPRCELRCIANFYTAYLWGDWQVDDVTDVSAEEIGLTFRSTKTVVVDDHRIGSLAFQALIGLQASYGNWSATVGYEINDWLNQCQIFDDATGPHNNDLILQGLTLRTAYEF